MALMIDRKQLAEAIDKLKFFSDGERAALRAVVYSVPAVDAVEVVRCMDCRYCKVLNCNGYSALLCDYRQHPTYANDFCAGGRRVADNGE